LDPKTGDAVATSVISEHYIGCNVQKGAPAPPPSNFTQMPIPRGAIAESC